MSDPIFSSSDSVRQSATLKYAQTVRFDTPLNLEMGGTLLGVTVMYETYGSLNADRSNAVLVCHALSGDSHVARHDQNDSPGWWDILIGSGRSLDTDRLFVVCANVLGGCRGTTGPNSIDPITNRPYGAEFPVVTITDMVEVQRWLIDHLQIDRLHAVIGGSLGGHQALTWAIRYPRRVANCVLLATSPRLTSQALAFDVVARNAITRDPHFHGGQYYDQSAGPAVGLALARMLGHITYLSRDAMSDKFDATRLQPREVSTEFEKLFSVGSYLAYQGHKFVERFDANSYVTLSKAMDLFDLGDTRQKLQDCFSQTDCRWLVISFSSDWLFPPYQSQQIVDALVADGKSVSYCNIESNCGHDAFLLEDDLSMYGGLVKAFLTPSNEVAGEDHKSPTSIFTGTRLDHNLILDLIPTGSGVLDLGCGDGDLLSLLRQRRAPSHLVGVELSEPAILRTVQRGLDVIQSDLSKPLSSFTDKQFDVVVLSQTLQSVGGTERMIDEMLRVGRCGIVSFPNFAYHKLRLMMWEQGRSPKTDGIFSYDWYNTPNRRFPSILDFQDFCRSKGLTVKQEVYLDTEADRKVTDNPNLNADLAIFVISRQESHV